MITALSWIPKGAAKAIPDRAKLPSKEEIEKLKESCKIFNKEEEEENGEVAHAKAVAEEFGKSSKSKSASPSMEVDDGLKELDMDNYDEEDDGIEIFSSGLGDLYYKSNEMDPYLKRNNDHDDDSDDDSKILPTDLMIVCARSDSDNKETNCIDVYVFEETSVGSPNMYSHQNIIVPAIPLCTAWLDCPLKGGEKGNFVAVGSDDTPIIEIWDLDVRFEVLPCVQLGGQNEEGNYKEGSHTEPVLGLAWNKEFRNILASASADTKVKVWDVATGTCKITMDHHTDKVQAVAWNHYAPEVLLSGSFDQTVVLKDGRQPSHSGVKWSVMSDVESLAWDPHSEHTFVVSLENGTVKGFDVRQASNSNPSFTLNGHDKAATSVSYNISAPNLLATASMDKTVKLWDLSNNEPSCIATHKPNAGSLFSIAFSADNPFLLAMGGVKGTLKVWDTLSDTNVSNRYGTRPVRP
ncbi:PREDICTED: periodic tryptophan protein 1 homolog [Camelina sativa]|uniref:Periodic tryptophan protein 1 homolog n=1 Tax=Camelina sativa TaxID=90675 RepID=A0ABM1QRR9_CAMSA|nr:PREDICTED: periodic tryptophan protein 1 homolog [Camelina sativa]